MVRNWQNADWICTRFFRKCGDDEILNISGTRPDADLRMNSMRLVVFFPTQPIHALDCTDCWFYYRGPHEELPWNQPLGNER